MTEETGRYRTPGELIQAAREGAHIDLGDLSSRTRIPEHVLSSLESDDYEALSGPLYVRSFLKAIAAELDLDTDQLIERYDRLVMPEDPSSEDHETTWETETSVERVEGLPWLKIIVGGAVVLAAVLLIWGGLSLLGDDQEGVEESVATALPTGTETGGEETPVISSPDPDAELGDVATTAVVDTSSVTPNEVNEDSGEDSAPLPASIPEGSERMIFAGGGRFPLVLRLVCSSRVGAAVAVDADTALHGVDWRSARAGVPEDGIEMGQPYRVGGRYVVYWGAQDHFVVRLEESEGVELTLNGIDKPIRQRNLGREWVLDSTRLRN